MIISRLPVYLINDAIPCFHVLVSDATHARLSFMLVIYCYPCIVTFVTKPMAAFNVFVQCEPNTDIVLGT